MDRLEAIVSLIDKCDVVADIGTDHGYVAEMVLKQSLCNKVIATDINKGPLSSAINHLNELGLASAADFRLGGGLTVISESEANCAVIAGMGGELIASILEESNNIARTIDTFVLQPMTNINVLRKYLYDNGYTIFEEILVKEFHHYYFIIKAKNLKSNCIKKIDEIFYEISEYLYEKKDKLLFEYIKKLINTNNKILLNLENSIKQDSSTKISEINTKIKKFEIMLKAYEN